MRLLLSLFILSLAFYSCDKEAGEGGTSAISGKIYKLATFQNANTGSIDTLYFQEYSDKDVYIIYSSNENDVYNDSFETSWNGEYRFSYLRKGDYTIFTYADSTDQNGVNYDFPVFLHINIDQNNQTYSLPDLIVNK
jgi:hypothetical protein